MKKYNHYIGVTETSDPGIFWKSIKKLKRSNVIITKHLENPEFRRWLVDNKERIILHATITGWGGTNVEPGVPKVNESFDCLHKLIDAGFPVNQVVIRIDPIIPNSAGIMKFINVLITAVSFPGITRIRFSVMDMYKHIRKTLREKGIDTSMYSGFQAVDPVFEQIDKMISYYKGNLPGISFESCAEKLLKSCEQIGCVSNKDLAILGLPEWCEGKSKQRYTCLCPANKIQLLGSYYNTPKCPSGCAYCYMRSNHI